MNQILITQKIYVTPELKRKKKAYRFNFFISIFLICLLFSYYIYAEYDRNKNEEISQEILSRMSIVQEGEDGQNISEIDGNGSIKIEGNCIVITLDGTDSLTKEVNITNLAKDVNVENESQQVAQVEPQPEPEPEQQEERPVTYTSSNGKSYNVDCILNIPSLGINYPVLSDYSEENLKISLNKFWGCKPNEVGNYVIAGHNYKNKKMFGKLSQMEIGDICEITDLKGNTIKYSVYDRDIVEPEDTSCTSQRTNGQKEVTLITCTNYGQQRLILKAREVT